MGDNGILSLELAVWSFACGVFLCGVYDIFRVTRLMKKQKALILFINDFLFCVIAALTLLVLFFNLSFGVPRLYAIVIVFIGFITWRYTVSRFYIWLIRKIIEIISNFLNSIKMRISAFAKCVLRFVYSGFYCRYTVWKSKNGFGIIKKLRLKRKEIDYEKNQTD